MRSYDEMSDAMPEESAWLNLMAAMTDPRGPSPWMPPARQKRKRYPPKYRVMSGIYEIWNSRTSQLLFIGSAKDLRLAQRKIHNRLERGRARNKRLQEAYEIFGDALEFRALAACDLATLKLHKRRFIGLLQPKLQGEGPGSRGIISRSVSA